MKILKKILWIFVFLLCFVPANNVFASTKTINIVLNQESTYIGGYGSQGSRVDVTTGTYRVKARCEKPWSLNRGNIVFRAPKSGVYNVKLSDLHTSYKDDSSTSMNINLNDSRISSGQYMDEVYPDERCPYFLTASDLTSSRNTAVLFSDAYVKCAIDNDYIDDETDGFLAKDVKLEELKKHYRTDHTIKARLKKGEYLFITLSDLHDRDTENTTNNETANTFSFTMKISYEEKKANKNEKAVQVEKKQVALSTTADLLRMKGSSDTFYLTNDIDMSEYGSWTPINFNGTLDGNGHAISNLKITGQNGGLFGLVQNAVIKNLELKNIVKNGKVSNISDGIKNWHMDGTLAYSAINSNISDISVSGEMDLYGDNIAHAQIIGGIVGRLAGKSVMERCANYANICYAYKTTIHKYINSLEYEGFDPLYMGGLAGEVHPYTKVLNCYNTGTIRSVYSGGNEDYYNYYYDEDYDSFDARAMEAYTCGLVGNLFGEMSFCYNVGPVIAEYGIRSSRNFAETYELGHFDGCMQNCYGLKGMASRLYSDDEHVEEETDCAEKTESELKTKSTYDKWDFSNVWMIDPAKNNGFPIFIMDQAQKPNTNYTSGEYTEPISVSLMTATPNAKIYYTLDGSEPTSKSKNFNNPIKINKTTTLRAISIADGYRISDEVTYKYIYQVDTPQTNKKSGKYQGTISVKLSCATNGAKIYYTTNGKTPTAKSTRYKGEKIKIKKNTILKVIAIKGIVKSKILTQKYIIKK